MSILNSHIYREIQVNKKTNVRWIRQIETELRRQQQWRMFLPSSYTTTSHPVNKMSSARKNKRSKRGNISIGQVTKCSDKLLRMIELCRLKMVHGTWDSHLDYWNTSMKITVIPCTHLYKGTCIINKPCGDKQNNGISCYFTRLAK